MSVYREGVWWLSKQALAARRTAFDIALARGDHELVKITTRKVLSSFDKKTVRRIRARLKTQQDKWLVEVPAPKTQAQLELERALESKRLRSLDDQREQAIAAWMRRQAGLPPFDATD